MKRFAAVTAIVALATLAHASPLPDYPFVYANGGAQEKLSPNTCKVAYQITVRDKVPTNGIRVLEARSTETLALLARHGVKKAEIVAFEVSKDVVRDHEKRDRLEFLGYEITRRIEFSLHDLQKYEPIVSVLLKTPDVSNIRTAFDRTDRKEIESRLMAKAVSDARAKAELMCDGSGQRIVRLRAISQHGFYNVSEAFGLGNKGYSLAMHSMSEPEQQELLFVPSTIEFTNSVSVIYEVAEKR